MQLCQHPAAHARSYIWCETAGLIAHPSKAWIMERGGALPAMHTRLTCRSFRLCCFTCCSRLSHTVGTPAASNTTTRRMAKLMPCKQNK